MSDGSGGGGSDPAPSGADASTPASVVTSGSGAESSAGGQPTNNEVMRADLSVASDANLVLGIARFHEEALAEAYRRHGGAVYALARRVLWDAALAEEVVQEIFLRLWSAPERFDPGRGSLRSFLLAQAHGKAVDVLRSESSRRRREQAEAATTAAGGYDVEREAFDLAVAEKVRAALGSLPEVQRRAIELAYFGGHSYREVARLLGQPEGTVKSRIRAGLGQLHRELVASGTGVLE